MIIDPNELDFDHVIQQEIIEAGDEGQRRYEDETPVGKQTAPGLENAINNAVIIKKQKLSAPFAKYLAIANPGNGSEFLEEASSLIHYFLVCSPG
jgi:hypothetical protein